jgi:hypothetical protein
LLSTLRAGRAAWLCAPMRLAHRGFFATAAAVVWFTHRAVLGGAGHSGRSFLISCRAQYEFYLGPTGVRAGSQEFASPSRS